MIIDSLLYDIFFREYKVEPGDTVFSLGAGIGEEVEYLSERVGLSGTVFAIEADPEIFKILKNNISKYRYKNVIAFNIAITDFVGSVNLVDLGDGGQANYIVTDKVDNSKTVPCTTMDKFVVDYNINKINYIKVNIEGAEVEFLKGFKNNYNIVKNWCVSCHDFTGIENQKTFDFVTNFFKERNIEFRTYNDMPFPVVEFYVYA